MIFKRKKVAERAPIFWRPVARLGDVGSPRQWLVDLCAVLLILAVMLMLI